MRTTFLLCLALVACVSPPRDRPPGTSPDTTEVDPPPPTDPLLGTDPAPPVLDPAWGAVVPGFFLMPSASKFQYGDFESVGEADGLHRAVGSDGAMGFHLATGELRSVPDALAPVLGTPTPRDPAAHSELVRAYFLGAGLPEDQLGPVQTLARAAGDGSAVAGGGLLDPAARLPSEDSAGMRFYTAIHRRLGGVLVAESVVWAAMNDAGQVLSEEVKWPEIPQSVVDDAAALDLIVRDPAGLAELAARLPTQGPIEVWIHHTTWAGGGAYDAFASYDVREIDATGAFTGAVRHFGRDGAERFLPEELREAANDPRP